MSVRDRIVELRRVRAGDLLADPRNWRRHPEAQQKALRSMLDDVGFADALLARETPEGLRLIDGHLRAEISPDEVVPVLVLDVDEDEAGRLLATLDPLAGMAIADGAALAELLAAAAFTEAGLLAHLREIAGLRAEAGLSEPDDVPAVPAEPRSRPGDLWILGEHRLLCGDSTDAAAVARLVGDAAIDLVVTSPPYNVGLGYQAYDDVEIPRADYLAFIEAVVGTWLPALRPGRYVAWNVGVGPRTHHLHQGVLLERLGLVMQHQVIWVKVGVPLPTFRATETAKRARRYTPNPRHEMIYLASKGPPELGGPIVLPGIGRDDVWEINQSAATRAIPAAAGERRHTGLLRRSVKAHPAVFPVELPAVVAAYLTAPGEVIADPFAGAGTTLIAAEMGGRRALGCEVDPSYVDVAVARWEAFTGQEAVIA